MQNTGGATPASYPAGVSSFFAEPLAGTPPKDSAFPDGLFIDNASPPLAPTNAQKNITVVENTKIGENQAGLLGTLSVPAGFPATLVAGDAFYVNDGAAAASNALVLLENSVVAGEVNINAGGAGAEIGIDSSIMSSLSIVTTGPDAQVWLGGNTIGAAQFIELLGGGSMLYLKVGASDGTANVYPAPANSFIYVPFGTAEYDRAMSHRSPEAHSLLEAPIQVRYWCRRRLG